jgi:hypothetical protein
VVKAGDIVCTTLDDWNVVPAGVPRRYLATLVGISEDEASLIYDDALIAEFSATP